MTTLQLNNVKTREEVMREIESNPFTYSSYLALNEDFRNRFVEFCMGVRGVQMTYDPFFKYIFNAETHPERLSDLLSQILGHPLTVKRMLPNEHRRITEKGSLLIMDILVEFEGGELADVEIQKIGYRFPGQRAACYSSDMVMRQYERVKALHGDKFTYKDLKKVYTIVFMETSGREMKAVPDHYLHRGKWVFDSGLKLELLQEFYFIALDVFLEKDDNKEEKNPDENPAPIQEKARGDEQKMSELEAWLYFIGSDKPEHIRRVVDSHPKFAEFYKEIFDFRKKPEEAIKMFSEALRILDENTVKFMIDEMKEEMEGLRAELVTAKGQNSEQQETIAGLQAGRIAQQETIANLQTDNADLRANNNSLQANNNSLQADNNALRRQLAELQKQLEAGQKL